MGRGPIHGKTSTSTNVDFTSPSAPSDYWCLPGRTPTFITGSDYRLYPFPLQELQFDIAHFLYLVPISTFGTIVLLSSSSLSCPLMDGHASYQPKIYLRHARESTGIFLPVRIRRLVPPSRHGYRSRAQPRYRSPPRVIQPITGPPLPYQSLHASRCPPQVEIELFAVRVDLFRWRTPANSTISACLSRSNRPPSYALGRARPDNAPGARNPALGRSDDSLPFPR